MELGGEREGVRDRGGGEREEFREVRVVRENVVMDLRLDVLRVGVEAVDQKPEIRCRQRRRGVIEIWCGEKVSHID